jgi:hypothetical protein
MHFGAMKFPSLFASLLVLCAAGCASSGPMSRVNANRALYDTWPSEIKEAVLSQRAIPGMNPDMVRVALGKPAQVLAGSNPGEEVWVYRHGASEGHGPNLQVGTTLGNMQVGTSAGVMGSEGEDAGEVMFKDGIVVRSNVIP